MRTCVLLFTLVAVPVQAQAPADTTAHRVPFASGGHTLELAVANGSRSAQGVVVSLAEAPAWVHVQPAELRLGEIAAGEEAVAAFRFDLDTGAPVGEAAPIRFTVTTETGGAVEKEVWIETAPPTAFRLIGAYPNPLRGRATLAYELPAQADVTVTVYDLLGRRVARLSAEAQHPGRQTMRWDAGQAAAGVYLWQLTAETADRSRHSAYGKLTVVR